MPTLHEMMRKLNRRIATITDINNEYKEIRVETRNRTFVGVKLSSEDRVVIPVEFLSVEIIDGHLFCVREDQRLRYQIFSALSGKRVTDDYFSRVKKINSRFALVTSLDYKRGLFSLKEEDVVLDCDFDEITPITDSLYLVRQHSETGVFSAGLNDIIWE